MLLKKEKFSWRKYFFPDIVLNEVLKIFGKIIPADLRKLIKTKGNKRSGGSILQIFTRSTLKTWKTV